MKIYFHLFSFAGSVRMSKNKVSFLVYSNLILCVFGCLKGDFARGKMDTKSMLCFHLFTFDEKHWINKQ